MVGIRVYLYALVVLLCLASVSALQLDVREARFSYDVPLIWTDCIESSIGCSQIVTEEIARSDKVTTQPLNATHETWTAEVTLSTSFGGTYTNVPLAIEVPKTAQLDASGNTPYAIRTEGHRRWILLNVPEIEDERTVKITVLKERLSVSDRVSNMLEFFMMF